MSRLRVGYVVPGHHLLPTAGPTRNVLSLAAELGRHVDLTLAFRGVHERPRAAAFEVAELDPGSAPAAAVDDAAVRGLSVSALGAYVGRIRSFARQRDFDVVLEKSWLLSGYVASLYRRRGTPAAIVENLVRVWPGRLGSPADLLGWARHRAVRGLVGRWMRRADLVIAETEPLARSLARHLGVGSVEVVGLGVDHGRFRPGERAAARAALGIDPGRTLLLYFGVLDRTHDLSAVIGALGELAHPPELHVAGDGEQRGRYEELARGLPVVFHGRVPHERIPLFVQASDLCIAPYDPSAFPDGEVAYSTLKIPEAMACARAVATVPGAHTGALVENGVSGFTLDNTAAAWTRLLAGLPERAELDRLGAGGAERAAAITWERTAARYLELCRGLAEEHPGRNAVRARPSRAR